MRNLSIAALILVATPAYSQPSPTVCSTWPEFKAGLAKSHREIPTSTGQVGDQIAVQLLVSPDGETWTLLTINAQGIACVLAAGKNWDAVPSPVKGEEPT